MATKADPIVDNDIQDLGLAEQGKQRIEWAFHSMPVLQSIRKHFIKTQPLAGLRVAACVSPTAEAANLLITLRDGGASITLGASIGQLDVAAALVRDYGIPVHIPRGGLPAEHVKPILENCPHILLDDQCELITCLAEAPELAVHVIGGTEDTASGALRLQARERAGVLPFPMFTISESQTRHMYYSRQGTGQSTLDGILRATNILLSGTTVVVAGYGQCGRGIAMLARGMGAHVLVTEINPVKALEAVMHGHRTMSMSEAAQIGDVFITASGSKNVISREHFEKLKSGAILCNAGHRNVEVDLGTLERMASGRRRLREYVEEYVMRDGRRIQVLAEGRPINRAAAEGHPASVMDISFANQALSAEYLIKHAAQLERKVYPVPDEIDRHVARMKLDALGIKIDRLTHEQEAYLAGWSEGN